MRTFRRIALALLAALLLFSLGAGAGYGAHWYLTKGIPTSEEADQFSVYWEAWHIVEDKFYGDIPDGSVLVYGAIRGALETLQDPYTIFVEPQPRALEKAELEGQFGGIGAYVARGPEGEVILTPMVDSPAEQAGVQEGDELIQVDDTPITPQMTTDEVVLLIRGEVDTQVKLALQRADAADPIVVIITRKVIETPSVEWRVLEQDHNTGYIRIRLFTERTGRELEHAIQDLREAGITQLILDLRDNGGGLLDAAVDVSSQFLHEGVVLYEDRRDQPEKFYSVKKGGLALDLPLAVLVNGGTASASEIVAGALRDYERGPLIGERTFGKGSVQLVYDLSDQSSLHVTVARWLTPNRHRIGEEGLAPDVEVIPSETDRASGADPQLEQAIAYLQNKDQ
ncbi:MAG: S41 family peptidase [Anaerolineales bacterium]|nr:MAG: S41 family peptidase [Anaerolineales bacterium]